ncbi:hypothetical protein [Moraxella ovis]|nr:hypothetical protein [Moraxella ovis]
MQCVLWACNVALQKLWTKKRSIDPQSSLDCQEWDMTKPVAT